MVGHVPRDIQSIVPLHFCVCVCVCVCVCGGGTIKCENTGKTQNKCGNGLEVPCKYIVKGPFHMILNVEKIIKDYLRRTTK